MVTRETDSSVTVTPVAKTPPRAVARISHGRPTAAGGPEVVRGSDVTRDSG